MSARVWRVLRLVVVLLLGVEIGSALAGRELWLNVSALLALAVLAVAWALLPREER
ncbi:hypothetical protein ACIOWI_33045 [Streptomyces sp. NPDC087659]|uniref:hypothetical protein n=1 Tax=Streptomyces sp. NPDC087659 TaxID=3365801 RepID=UPI003830CD42